MEFEILKKATASCQRLELRFGFIRQQMKAYPVTVLCRVMGVSRRGFYEYLRRFTRELGKPPAQGAVEPRARLIFKQSQGEAMARAGASKN